MKSILVISESDLKRDPRVYRQLSVLATDYSVTALGFASPEIDGVEFLPMTAQDYSIAGKALAALMLIARQYQSVYWSRSPIKSSLAATAGRHFDIILANDITALPLALKIANGQSRVVFDAHEYAPREFEDRWLWKLVFQKYRHYLCQRYLPKVDGMMTVCQGISDEYQRVYGVKSIVVTNAPPQQNLHPRSVEDEVIRMIHHGGAMPSRHLEDMIEMMGLLDKRFQLDFMLMPSVPGYLKQLKKLAATNQNIRFIEPVAMQDISTVCNQYDIGVFLLPPVNFNYLHALPNKLFEFMQACLAVAIGPSPEMQRLVERYDCGVVAKDFSPQSLAESLSALTADKIRYYKQQASLAAVEQCAEHNATKIIDLIEGN